MATWQSNLDKLRSASRRSTTEAQQIETQAADQRGQAGIRHAQDIANKLAPLSEGLREWKRRDIKHKQLEGKEKARQDELEKAEKLTRKEHLLKEIEQAKKDNALLLEFKDVQAQDIAAQKLKQEILELYGPDFYPDAAQIEGLTPWQKVGYAKEKLRLVGNQYEDQLQYAVQNWDYKKEPIIINGTEITPEELNDPTISIPFKKRAIEIISDRLNERLGLPRYSKELRRVTGIEDKIQGVKESWLAKERDSFIKADAAKKQGQAKIDWRNSDKTSADMEQYMLRFGNTINPETGMPYGNSGALDQMFTIWQEEGIEKSDPDFINSYRDTLLPASIARDVGAKPGTTFGQQWPQRFASTKAAIKAGYVKQVNAERAYQEAFGTELQTQFTDEVRALALQGQVMTTPKVNEYKAKFQAAGLPIPEDISKWETTSMRSAREDKGFIESLKASQGGVITNAQLDQFNPLAAAEYRKEADNYEEGLLEDYDTENLIKATLDQTFTGMGLKGNEKNRIYREALKNAKQDYIKQYNELRGMGFDDKHANYLALNGTPGEFKTKDGQQLVGFQGVLNEIDTKGEASKYVRTGQNVQNTLGDAYVRVGYVGTAKEQIQKDPNSVLTGLLGGQYGQDQLNIIAANIEKFGLDRGLNMSTSAVDFYRGISNGTDLKTTGGWMGILDAQLKANIPGHQGLWPKGNRNPTISLITGQNEDGAFISDPSGLKALTDQAIRTLANANSVQEYMYAIDLLKDAGYNTSSLFDNPGKLIDYMEVN